MKTYRLKSGKKIAFATMPRPRDGDVVYLTFAEWKYIKECGFSDAHKDFLWNQKYKDFRFKIIPEGDLKTQKVAISVCSSIIEDLRPKEPKKEEK